MARNYQNPPPYSSKGADGKHDVQKVTRDYGERIKGLRDRNLWPYPKNVKKKVELFGECWTAGFSDQITEIDLSGYFAGHKLSMNKAIEENVRSAFREIAEFCKEPPGYEIRLLSGYLFRYAQNSSNIRRYRDNSDYKKKVVEWAVTDSFWKNFDVNRGWARKNCQYWREAGASYDAVKGKFGLGDNNQIVQLGHLSNHSFGTAIDINWGENPQSSTDLQWDMPKEIVRIMREHGFCWGGYYKTTQDSMHFEYMLPYTQQARVFFPFNVSTKEESPMKYYYENELSEAKKGGYYPTNLYRGLHGGIHITPGNRTDLVPVKSVLPGYIVAARLIPISNEVSNLLLQDLVGHQHIGMVLIRHQLQKLNGTEPSGAPLDLYCLYMHLAPPNWDNPGRHATDIPWLKRFFEMQYGGVVNLNPQGPSFGKNVWATKIFTSGDPTFVVGGQNVPAKKDGRITAIGKASPEDVTQAIEGFKAGALVTFDKPLLQVKGGEVIGFVQGVGNNAPVIHWELLCPTGTNNAIQQMVKLETKLKDKFIPFEERSKDDKERSKDNKEKSKDNKEKSKDDEEELKYDNFFDSDELNDLAKLLPDKSKKVFDSTLKLVKEAKDPVQAAKYYKTGVTALFREGATFAEEESQDDASTKELFTYPVKLLITNPHKYKGKADGSNTKINVAFMMTSPTDPEKKVPVGKKGTIEIQNMDQMEFVVHVPAQADIMVVSADDCFFDLHNESDPVQSKQKKLEDAQSLFSVVLDHRWRNVVLTHINEWTPAGFNAQMTTMKEKKLLTNVQKRLAQHLGKESPEKVTLDEIKKALRPIPWWGKEKTSEDPQGEIPVLGAQSAEKSIFGDGQDQLSKTGEIDNLHPVTAAWLIDYLWDNSKLKSVKQWPSAPLMRDQNTDEPPFAGLVFDDGSPAVGAQAHAVVVQHGYGSNQRVAFAVMPPSGDSIKLGEGEYKEGVATCAIDYSFWGSWELKCHSIDTGKELKPMSKAACLIETKKPVFADMPFAVTHFSKRGQVIYSATLHVKEALPLALEGYIYFRCWKTARGEKPDFTKGGDVVARALPVVARRQDPKETKRGGLVYKAGFIVRRVRKNTNPDITDNFRFLEFVKRDDPRKQKKVQVFDGNEAEFQVYHPLCLRLQDLRQRFNVKLKEVLENNDAVGKLYILKLEKNGLTLTFTTRGSGTEEQRVEALDEILDAFNQDAQGDNCMAERPDQAKAEFIISCAPPAQDSGVLSFDFSIEEIIGRVIHAVALEPGKDLHVRVGFFAPNGGHRLFPLPPSRHYADEETLVLDVESAKKNVTDSIDFLSDVKFPVFTSLGFGQVSKQMSATAIITSVELFGETRSWKKALPKFSFTAGGKTTKAGSVNRNELTEAWTIRTAKGPRRDRWGKEVELSIVVTKPEALAYLPVFETHKFTIKPRIEYFRAAIEDGHLKLEGKTEFVPTSIDLEIECEDENGVPDEALKSELVYITQGGNKKYGRCDSNGKFLAILPIESALAGGGKRIFRLIRAKAYDSQGLIWGEPFPESRCEYPTKG